MKTRSTTAVVLVLATLLTSCAGAYSKCVKPEITAATKLAPAELAKVVEAFLMCGGATSAGMAAPCAVEGLGQLAIALGPGGQQAVNCLIAYYTKNGATPALKANAKAVGAKRGVTEADLVSCNGLGGGRLAEARAFTVARTEARSPSNSFDACDLACGGKNRGLPVDRARSCICWQPGARRWTRDQDANL